MVMVWKAKCKMSLAVKKSPLILAVLLLALTTRAWAQKTAGETSMNLTGTVSAGYSNDSSNIAGSDHSLVFGGTADLSGSYYNPNFLSFDVQPFYNQSRLNSNFQSITSSSGVNASAKIFGGSNFPGSVSYTAAFNSSGNFNIPGLANYTTHGNNDALVVNWGVHVDDLPNVNFTFSNANNDYSIYGTNTWGSLHANTFSVTTAYKIAGFNLDGGYQHAGTQNLTPEFFTDHEQEHADTGANSFAFGVGHDLPWHGSFSAAATHLAIATDLGDSAAGDRYNTTIDTVTGSANFAPRQRLNVGANTFYTDNLEGTLYNTLLTSGVTVPLTAGQLSSHNLSVTGYADYQMPEEHLVLHGFVERQQQTFLGISFASDSYNGMATYSNTLLGGSFNGVVGVTHTTLVTSQESLTGLNTSVNYTHQIDRWNVGGSFGYSQDAQTVLIAYTTSGYTYVGSVGRRLGRRSYWGAFASGARNLLTNQPGSANSSQSYSTSFSLPRVSFNGTYSRSSGNALLTPTGLVPTSLPLPIITPAAVVFYHGNSFSVGLGAHPTRGLTLSAIYAKALSGTQTNATNSNNNNENLDILMTYNVRKLNFITGYSRLNQGFSLSGAPPAVVGSFFVGVSRWFNFF